MAQDQLIGTEHEPNGDDQTGGVTRARSQLLVLFGLTGFAISQPLLSVLGDNPTVFSANAVAGWRVATFAVLLAAVPPVALWLVVRSVTAANRHAGERAFLAVIAALSALTAIQYLKAIGLESRLALQSITVIAGLGLPYAYRRVSAIRDWTRFTCGLPALAVALFLFASPAGDLALTSAVRPNADVSSAVPSIVMVVLDEFPTKSILDIEGEIDDVRFPNLAAFADDATWYRHYSAMSPFTGSAIPSMLSGRAPQASAPIFTNYPDTIFSLLAPTHDIAAFESATTLCHVEGCSAFEGSPQVANVMDATADILRERISYEESSLDLGEYAEETVRARDSSADGGDGLLDLWAGSELERVPTRVSDFMTSLRPQAVPIFRYVHLMLPHSPWLFWNDGTRYAHSDEFGVNLPRSDRAYIDRWSLWTSTVTEQRHLLQASYTDSIVGAIMDRLQTTGMYNDSLVVVAADHGVTFRPRTSTREPTALTIDDIAYVPLLVKAPGQTDGSIDDSNLMAVDLLPTIAAALGVEVPWEIDGHAAGSPEIAARGDEKTWYEFVNAFNPRLGGTFEFSDSENFPSADERLIPPLDDRDSPMSALLQTLNVDDFFGQRLDDLERRPQGQVVIDHLADLRAPPADGAAYGVVTGRLVGVPWAESGCVFVLVVDGTIVTGSRISVDADGVLHVMVLLPPGLLDEANDIRAALLTVLGTVELTVA